VKPLRTLSAVLAWATLAAVVAQWAVLRLLAERWWVATLNLYVPFTLWLLPVAACALLLVGLGPRRRLWIPGVAALVVLFPLMGLSASLPHHPTPGAPRLRVLAYNVDSGWISIPAMVAEVEGARPDVVVLVESTPRVNEAVVAAFPGYHSVESGQFLVASRYPLVDFLEPPKLHAGGVDRSPRFVRVTLETPMGPVDLFGVHPISPRDAVENVRGQGLLTEIRSGRVFQGDRTEVARNTALRRLQVEAIAGLAAATPNPVIIAGDTNLPGPSPMLHDLLGRWKDGFDAAGNGFGYTYPLGRRGPWMRIDRILAGPGLRFVDFTTGSGTGSDHRAVWADLEPRGR
jgi:vancomycin resistance protein VanJ